MKPMIYVFRHGETEWSRTGRHTGQTDVPLTERGRRQAEQLRPIFAAIPFERILSSPLSRARETAEIASGGRPVQIRENLHEWDYGEYEGRTTEEIRRLVPGWTIWTHPCPGGETADQVAARADQAIAELAGCTGDCAIVAHGHFLRVLASRWVGEPPTFGRHFILETGTYSALGREHGNKAIAAWNAALAGPTSP